MVVTGSNLKNIEQSNWIWGSHSWRVALAVKNPLADSRDVRDAGLIPGLGKPPGGGYGNPSQYSCLENAMDRGAWWAAIRRAAQSWTPLKWLSTGPARSSHKQPREGNSRGGQPRLGRTEMGQRAPALEAASVTAKSAFSLGVEWPWPGKRSEQPCGSHTGTLEPHQGSPSAPRGLPPGVPPAWAHRMAGGTGCGERNSGFYPHLPAELGVIKNIKSASDFQGGIIIFCSESWMDSPL